MLIYVSTDRSIYRPTVIRRMIPSLKMSKMIKIPSIIPPPTEFTKAKRKFILNQTNKDQSGHFWEAESGPSSSLACFYHLHLSPFSTPGCSGWFSDWFFSSKIELFPRAGSPHPRPLKFPPICVPFRVWINWHPFFEGKLIGRQLAEALLRRRKALVVHFPEFCVALADALAAGALWAQDRRSFVWTFDPFWPVSS